ncbi:hypothetical protein D8B26_005133 [Coccidioides posadasii str. Silveira]|uniref:Uncharacterized protein n=3 Tax=Coccidioides posadasii TaxID=199306 RepID=E9D5Y7_COCPS|nr:hypothetical protein CPC735_059050 [Coccidioides posadasii C735 delta SOWgp]EER24535.1 hypothetical protein CPC735_059050 [Coccidioides posadasii C735 delta SOWgp]EFW18331.1 conserved hypothetical protein [Coccidioides posadasii str. Silveira]KMM66288.1 hypothetical protein CPAG_02627 [Coccidioides posadasii RMSCC 3488]QVM10474.1 hypothetical protein D8B26_005133 [Coccidioides posadasii str. Silveira]|eukprot:XP_003066680.1 hypothetical protein CPC735_059050 [Coccidioides posadasii C735 delta SOWgp]
MADPPFSKEDELYRKLSVSWNPPSIHRQPISGAGVALTKDWLPGQPRIRLQDAKLALYLESELITKDLDKLAPNLWLVATPDSSDISSLTHQIVRGRQITVTEKPELHLVWSYDRVFIKPIPKYLLSHAFWEFYLNGARPPIPGRPNTKITSAALGFLRSYFYLIQHRSDFAIATNNDHRLIPKHISYAQFSCFIRAFGRDRIGDDVVSPRYAYGELGLTRLNLSSKVFLQRFTYHKVHGQYGARLAQFYGPVLFMIGIFSLVLSALEVALSVQAIIVSGKPWMTFARLSRWFAIFTIVCSAILALLPAMSLVVLAARESRLALKKLQENGISLRPALDKEGDKTTV